MIALDEINNNTKIADTLRVKGKGGGRKKVVAQNPNLQQDLDNLIEPATRGDSEKPLRCGSKSTIKLTEEVQK